MSTWVILLLLLCPPADEPVAPRRDVVVVTGVYEPVPLEEADRAVRALPIGEEQRLLAPSAADFLRLDPSLDLRSRAPNGVQADLSIRGGSFGQTLVLLDGMRLNDAQTGHFNLDIPAPLDALDRVEMLKGAGSAYYGSDAVGGVINLITRKPEAAEFRLRTSGGNFGSNAQSGAAGLVWRSLSQHFSFSRDFSSGFAPNRDYRNLSLASITHASSRLGGTRVLLAHTDRPYGADQFYGNFNSWERTRTWFAAARQELGSRTDVSGAYRRHTDLFVLYRDRPQIYTNRHAVENGQVAVRRREPLGANVTLNYGAEGYRDSIASTNLGNHARGRGAGYVALDVRSLHRFAFSLAAREEFYSGGRREFSPSASAGFWVSERLRLRAGASRAFRLPSYTELYYHDPANIGSPDLRPETAWSYEAGLDWYAGGRLRGDVTVFHRRERDGIDYIRRSLDDIWRAANFSELNFTGVEISAAARVGRAQLIDFRYSGLRGASKAVDGVYTKYVFNYPVHAGLVSWEAALAGGFIARARLAVTDRRGRDPYAVWDAGAAYARGRLRPFLQLTNLTGTVYEEVLGVAMPGRGIAGGVELVIIGSK
ncbi:MAG TPA: TonB-dependent receptor [Bryobacteraceae bacterium]|nr:TonB-dependent receptor [Bryobacteraceae bacterium]HOQ45772.1 TonB-dependent receptor [Bryobacteraceae bacterium]HPU71501.1 TonB-dependent receptor [Bryobacteraceae bacterium]